MLLKSIKLTNFRQYRGEQLVEFSCDPEKNVTVILGDNTSGKTTFVQAFKWALYGSTSFSTRDVMLNMDLQREMNPGDEEKVEVEINLEHDNTEYFIIRSQDYSCNVKGVVDPSFTNIQVLRKMEDGQTQIIDDKNKIESTINKILPEDLSSYFFFDGESIESISREKDITNAVKGLLGLSVLEKAMEHLKPTRKDTVMGQFRESLVKGDEEAEKFHKQLEYYQEELKENELMISSVNEEIEFYDEKRKHLESILREHEETAITQREREMAERKKEQDEKELKEKNKNFITYFNTSNVVFFAQPLMNEAYELLRTVQVDDKGIPNMNASSIDFLIKRGQCVCGRKIHHGDEAYNYLIEQKGFLPPESIGIMIHNFINTMDVYQSTVKPYEGQMKTLYSDIQNLRNSISESVDEIDYLTKKIEGKVDVIKIEKELAEVKAKYQKSNEKKDELNIEKGKIQNEINKYNDKIDESTKNSERNKKITLYMRYTEELYNWFESKYEEEGKKIREELEQSVNEIFNKMYHGQREVEIDDRYRIVLHTIHEGERIKTDESKGLETVKNFAFICGLVDLARKKVNKDTTDDVDDALKTEPYPLVMDAPFSNADERHVKSISKVVPEIAEQVIMVVMDKDWKYAEEIIGTKVGKRYVLDKKSETLTFIEGEERCVC